MGQREVRTAVVSVATTRTRLVRPRATRTRFYLVNQGSNTVYYLNDLDVSTTRGYRLTPGSTATIKPETDGSDVVAEWHALADGAAANVFVREYEHKPEDDVSA